MIEKIMLGMTMFLSLCNCIVMVVTFIKFVSAPRKSVMARIADLEKRVTALEDDTSELRKALNVIMHSVLALIEFEMSYCLTEHKEMSDGLKKAKDDIHDFLTDK